jgi:hypothetical protein
MNAIDKPRQAASPSYEVTSLARQTEVSDAVGQGDETFSSLRVDWGF